MKISLKDLKAALSYLEKNSDRDNVDIIINNDCTLTTLDSSGSEIQITLFQASIHGEPSVMAKVKRTELLPFK